MFCNVGYLTLIFDVIFDCKILTAHTEYICVSVNSVAAVISALKNLQEKIHQLETERTAAEDNLKSLATETNKYRDILQRESEQRRPAQTTVSKHNQGTLLDKNVQCNM